MGAQSDYITRLEAVLKIARLSALRNGDKDLAELIDRATDRTLDEQEFFQFLDEFAS